MASWDCKVGHNIDLFLPLLLFRTLLHWQQGNREDQRGCKRKLATHILNPTPIIDQVCSGRTQRAAISETSRTKTEMFQRTATSNVEEAPKSKTTQNAPKVSSWSYDMKGHADQCADIFCELANKSESQLKQAATICIDDHELNRNMLKSLLNRLSVCAQIALNSMYLARNWSTRYVVDSQRLSLEQSQSKAKACDQKTGKVDELHSLHRWL